MKNKKAMPVGRQGFTLIELLVVIAIIGLLSTLAVVSLNGARSKARDARRTSDLKALQSAIEMYKADNNDTIFALPATWALLGTTLASYLPAGAPADPGTTTDYNVCVNTTNNNYVVAGTLENTAPAPGVQAVWTTNTLCRNEAAAQVLPTCNTTTGFCLGYSQ